MDKSGSLRVVVAVVRVCTLRVGDPIVDISASLLARSRTSTTTTTGVTAAGTAGGINTGCTIAGATCRGRITALTIDGSVLSFFQRMFRATNNNNNNLLKNVIV